VGAKILLGGEAADADEAETATPTEGEEPATFGHIVSLEPFTVNLDENAGSRYLRVKINLEIENESFEQDFNTRLPVIRDVILLLLSGLTYDSISSPTGKQDLKDQIVERVNTIMRGDVVRRVLFEDFLVQ
jgi:flagellar FliL protein